MRSSSAFVPYGKFHVHMCDEYHTVILISRGGPKTISFEVQDCGPGSNHAMCVCVGVCVCDLDLGSSMQYAFKAVEARS